MKYKKIVKKDFPFFLMMPALVWQLLFFYVPICMIILLSVIKTQQITGATFFTLVHYKSFFAWSYFKIIGRSLILAIVTSLLTLFFCYPVAYFISFRVKKYKNLFLFFLILPFFTSLLIQVYAWFFLLEKEGLINNFLLFTGIIKQPLTLLNNLFSIYLVMFYCYLPFMLFPIYTIMEKMNLQLLESSLDLGASPWQTFLRITLPLSMPGIRTGLFLVFIPAFGEFVIPTLMGGNKQFYVGSLIAHYFLAAQNPHTGATFTIIACFVLIIVAFLFHLLLKKVITKEVV